MLRATTACTFSTSKGWSDRQKVARTCGNFHIRHQNVLGATTACTFSTSQLPKVARTCGNFSIFSQNVLGATTACTFSTSQLPKVVRTRRVFPLFTCKYALRHNGVHFFHISTPKSGSELTCLVHFYFQMCFAPQRRALFPHLNFRKCSENDVFWHFWLQNVLRAKTACNFSSVLCPDVSAPAALASLPFDPPEPQKTGKTQCFATFLPFRAPASSLFWLSPSLIFSLLTFSTSEFLPGCAISISPYCRKFSFQTSFDYLLSPDSVWKGVLCHYTLGIGSRSTRKRPPTTIITRPRQESALGEPQGSRVKCFALFTTC